MLSLVESATVVRVQTWDAGASIPAGLREQVDSAWPSVTGTVASGLGIQVLCISPCEWLMLGTERDAFAAADLPAGAAFRATDLSAALTVLRLDGPRARTVLSKGCSVDLHPRSFESARVARTRFAGMAMIVHCTDEAKFDLIVARSHAQYLIDWITDAAAEF